MGLRGNYFWSVVLRELAKTTPMVADEAGAVLGKNIGGACPPKFPLPFSLPLSLLPPVPLNFSSHPCPPFPSLPFSLPSPFFFLIPSFPSLSSPSLPSP